MFLTSLTNDAGGLFSIDAGGIVRVAGGLDAETATSHSITVRATSTDSSIHDNSFTIGIQDIDEFPLSGVADSDAANNIAIENSLIGTAVGIRAGATDLDSDDTVTFSLSNDAGGLFTIDPNTGIVTIAGAIDAETANSHSITVQASSTRSGTTSANFDINVSDTNEFSISTLIDQNASPNQVLENAVIGDQLGITALATDADATDSVSYSLTNDGGGRFTIDSNGIVRVAANLDAESADSHMISIQAESSDGSMTSLNVTISILDVNDNSLSQISDSNAVANSIIENATPGTDTGIQALAVDLDVNEIISYSLINDAGGRFSIDSNTGIISLVGNVDAETSQVHTVTVQANSVNSGSSQTDFIIAITDFNESTITAPVDVDATNNIIDEHSQLGSYVGLNANSVDLDISDNVTYTLTGGNGLFAIDSAGRVLVAGELDAEILNQHTVIVLAESSDGSAMSTTFDIQVNDIEDNAPVIAQQQSFSINENVIGPLLVGSVNATDNDTLSNLSNWQIDSGNDSALFEINTNNGDLYLANGQSADFEALSSYSLDVSVSDGTNRSATEQVIIQVIDNNEAPITASDSVIANEDTVTTFAISSLITGNDRDPEGDPLTLIETTPALHGTVQINSNDEIAYTPDANYHGVDQFQYTVSDSEGNTAIGVVEILVISTNDAPELLIASTITINENDEVVNANIQATDSDGDSLQFSLAGDDASLFTIDEQSGEIHFRDTADFENPRDSNSDNIYDLSIVASDNQGASTAESVSIEVLNTNDQHTVTADTIEIGEFNTDIIGSINVQDQDIGDTYTYTIIDSNAGDALQIDDQGRVQQLSPLVAGSYYLDVSVRDQLGGEVVFRLNILSINDQVTSLGAATPNTDLSSNPLDILTDNIIDTTNQGQTSSPSFSGSSPNNDSEPDSTDSVFDQLQSASNANEPESSEKNDNAKNIFDVNSILDEIALEANLIAGQSFTATKPSTSDKAAGSENSNSRGKQLLLDTLLNSNGESENTLGAFSVSFNSQISDLDLSPQLLNALKKLNDGFDNALEQETQSKELVVTSVTVITGTLSVGLVTWLLNSGSLLATALTTSPLWRSIDPIPVIVNRGQEENWDRRSSDR